MQETAWDREYRENRLVTLGTEPQASVKEFLRWLRKEAKDANGNSIDIANCTVLDLGCGTGRNTNYLAGLGARATGIEISQTALTLARKHAISPTTPHVIAGAEFFHGSIGEPFPFASGHYDLILDVTSSNSLNEAERDIYINESYRVLKPGGLMFVRALCKDGDINAQTLIKKQPGKEKDTYIMPETGIIERAFSKADFEATYSRHFEILYLDKETHYTKMNNRSYKRNFWIAYLKKRM